MKAQTNSTKSQETSSLKKYRESYYKNAAHILHGNTFPNFSVTKVSLHFQEVKIIQFLEMSFDTEFFHAKIKI